MYAITGISGRVGGIVAKQLLAAGLPVRAVLRQREKAAYWEKLGCEIAIAAMENSAALARAFSGARAVFILPPSEFDPAPGFPEANDVINAVSSALALARPDKVVCLSTIGAQAGQENLLTQRTLMERALSHLALPVTFLRPGWFMDNAEWDVGPARAGKIISFLQPLDRPVPMVATEDVGRAAAALLQEDWHGVRVVELEGPHRTSPQDIAATFAALLGHPVAVEAVPAADWEALFRAQGMRHPEYRIAMLRGFNEGWIDFEQDAGRRLQGTVTLESVLRRLIEKTAP